MPLQIATNNGGDGYYYATFYAPYDVLLPTDADGMTYNAYVCKAWDDAGLNPTKVTTSGYTDGKFVPAGTPVIIRVKDESGTLTLTLPSTSPSSAKSCVFTGQYLEQKLAVDASHDVYTFGLPNKSTMSKDEDYSTTGDIVAPLPEFETSGVGFYINATYDKESDPLQSLWQRNNRYVLHNKIYYRAADIGGARETTRGIDFVPVIFDEENGEEPDIEHVANGRSYPLGVYDLLGRCVATEEEVKDGSWRQRVAPGVYIVHGKKVMR
jgi:hypothetical protein